MLSGEARRRSYSYATWHRTGRVTRWVTAAVGAVLLVLAGPLAAPVSADPVSPLVVSNTASPSPVTSGTEITYTIVATNSGGAKVSNLVMSGPAERRRHDPEPARDPPVRHHLDQGDLHPERSARHVQRRVAERRRVVDRHDPRRRHGTWWDDPQQRRVVHWDQVSPELHDDRHRADAGPAGRWRGGSLTSPSTRPGRRPSSPARTSTTSSPSTTSAPSRRPVSRCRTRYPPASSSTPSTRPACSRVPGPVRRPSSAAPVGRSTRRRTRRSPCTSRLPPPDR